MAATTASAARHLSDTHRLYVKALYKRYLTNALNWAVHRDVWREQALEIRAEFDRHRNETDPHKVADAIAATEAKLAAKIHPDPYISAKFPGGTGWERNLPPPPNAFIQYDDGHHPTEAHAETESVQEVDLFPAEDRERLGHDHRLSRRARTALQELVEHARVNKVFVDLVTDKSTETKPDGSKGPSAWDNAISALREKGIDTSALETDVNGKKFSEYSEEEKDALLKNFEGPFWEHLDMRARGVLEQEISDKRDQQDDVYR